MTEAKPTKPEDLSGLAVLTQINNQIADGKSYIYEVYEIKDSTTELVIRSILAKFSDVEVLGDSNVSFVIEDNDSEKSLKFKEHRVIYVPDNQWLIEDLNKNTIKVLKVKKVSSKTQNELTDLQAFVNQVELINQSVNCGINPTMVWRYKDQPYQTYYIKDIEVFDVREDESTCQLSLITQDGGVHFWDIENVSRIFGGNFKAGDILISFSTD